jgi:4-hydroxy-tetrahydrodipicolinate reductase
VTTVAVSGAAGKMGRLVAEAIAAADDLELGPLFDPGHAGASVAGAEVTSDPLGVALADVVVEFTRPDVVMSNLADWRRLGVHVVVGTSGFDAARVLAVEEMWGSGPPNCLIVPNFSIGAVLMMRFAAEAAPHFAAAEIIELHNVTKVDAPSGTAIATAERLGGEVPIHSVRLPGLVAHQEVILGGVGETLTIRHDTSDRSAFIPGVLLGVRNVAELASPVTVGLEALLG